MSFAPSSPALSLAELPDLTPEEEAAAIELAIREQAAADIVSYAQAIEIPGAPVIDDPDTEFFKPVESSMADHHRLILRAMDETAATPHGRLMIFAPPGSAKSSYASVVWPSAYLARHPNRRVILASYGDDLARKMGRRVRSIVRQRRYRGIWGCHLASDSSAADQFALSNGSEYMACGILSGVTGNRAHVIILDDPIKGREQANSETIREKTWSAYEDDLKTRLIPGGVIILIQTRWHEDDPAGRILPEGWNGESGMIKCRDGNTWRVLCLQACCETDSDPLGRARGEYLWPQWFDAKHWAQFKNNPRTWSALYQQRPAPLAGDFFKPDQMQVVDAVPAGVTDWCRGWDLAATTDDGDWTAGVKIGAMPDGRFVVADVERLRRAPDERDAAIRNAAARDGKHAKQSLPQDPGQAGKQQAQHFVRMLAGHIVSTSPETGDKATRAEAFASQVNVGNVVLVRGAWNDAFVAELRAFPNGTHDDQVDGASRAFNELTLGVDGLLGYYRAQAEAKKQAATSPDRELAVETPVVHGPEALMAAMRATH
ncbi:MAG: phage terminase large subunit [Burkholderiales bacterium]|jgi:predicted phage terminase large subunit-like protein